MAAVVIGLCFSGLFAILVLRLTDNVMLPQGIALVIVFALAALICFCCVTLEEPGMSARVYAARKRKILEFLKDANLDNAPGWALKVVFDEISALNEAAKWFQPRSGKLWYLGLGINRDKKEYSQIDTAEITRLMQKCRH